MVAVIPFTLTSAILSHRKKKAKEILPKIAPCFSAWVVQPVGWTKCLVMRGDNKMPVTNLTDSLSDTDHRADGREWWSRELSKQINL